MVAASNDGTGNAFATMLLGVADGGEMTHSLALATASAYGALFVQDDYQARPNLTFNVGCAGRSTFRAPSVTIGSITGIRRCLRPSRVKCRPLRAFTAPILWARWSLLVPRAPNGAATRARHSGKTLLHDWASPGAQTIRPVIRGGYGIVYQVSEMQASGASGGSGTDGFTSQTNFNFTLTNGATVATTFNNPAPNGFALPQGRAGGADTFLGLGISDTFFDTYANPYSVEANLSIQRQLPGNVVLTAGYIYNHGVHQW